MIGSTCSLSKYSDMVFKVEAKAYEQTGLPLGQCIVVLQELVLSLAL